MKRLVIFSLLLLPGAASANVVWPALIMETRLFSWWAITIGLIVEMFFLRYLFPLQLKQIITAVFCANLASALGGIIFIPLAGIAWELFPGSLYMRLLGWGTFNPITWIGTFVMACIINATIEWIVYRRWFIPAFRFKSRKFLWIVLANTISVGAASISLWLKPAAI